MTDNGKEDVKKESESDPKEPIKEQKQTQNVSKNKKTVQKESKPKDARFAKARLVKAKRFSLIERSFLSVILKDGEQYTFEETEKLLKNALNRKVEK